VSSRLPVFLIDLDGVLVEPRGYRLAIRSALNWFTERMGLGDMYPGEDAIAGFEAITMTSEWDITAILLASIFNELVKQYPGLSLPVDVLQACDTVKDSRVGPPSISFDSLRSTLSDHFQPGMQFADLAYELSRPINGRKTFSDLAENTLLENILARTRMLDGSLSTRVFQHFTLGSEKFEEFTGFGALFNSESYLMKYDRVLLKENTRKMLLTLWEQSKCGVAIFTARPSLPQSGKEFTYNYSPEAEIALQALHLSALPLIAGGKMGWLALKMGLSIECFIKPSPVQALAAIGAAVTRQSEAALLAAADFYSSRNTDFFKRLPPLSIHVFEDSGGNISSVRKAAQLLNAAGFDIHFKGWGISQNEQKQKALMEAGAVLVTDINQAISNALSEEKL